MDAERDFPALPNYRAEWAPVFLEPIAGSGERITIGIAVREPDGDAIVQPTLNENSLHCLLGANAPLLIGVVDLCLDSLREHLKSGLLQDWRPPVSGATLGVSRVMHSTDSGSLLRLAVRRCSFIASLPTGEESVVEPAADRQEDRWQRLVQDAVTHRAPQLADYFGRSFQTQHGARRTRLNYIGQHYAANLGRLIPGPQIARYIKEAKGKLWDLDALRTYFQSEDNMFGSHVQSFELLLWRPDDNDPTYSDKALATLAEALLELEGEGDKKELRVVPLTTAELAAERIVQFEQAA